MVMPGGRQLSTQNSIVSQWFGRTYERKYILLCLLTILHELYSFVINKLNLLTSVMEW